MSSDPNNGDEDNFNRMRNPYEDNYGEIAWYNYMSAGRPTFPVMDPSHLPLPIRDSFYQWVENLYGPGSRNRRGGSNGPGPGQATGQTLPNCTCAICSSISCNNTTVDPTAVIIQYCTRCFGDCRFEQSHKQYHKQVKFHKCPLCPVRYLHFYQLKTHMLTHFCQRPFQCHYCERSFTTMHYLKLHERIHNPVYRFVCQYCGKGYEREVFLHKHEKKHEQGLL